MANSGRANQEAFAAKRQVGNEKSEAGSVKTEKKREYRETIALLDGQWLFGE